MELEEEIFHGLGSSYPADTSLEDKIVFYQENKKTACWNTQGSALSLLIFITFSMGFALSGTGSLEKILEIW